MDNKKEREIRTIYNLIVRANSDDKDSRMVEGTAIVFNSDSQNIGFIERIMPQAIDNNTIAKSDIFALLNHQFDRGVLARCRYGKGNLNLTIEDDGLHYSFNAPKTQLGDEVLEYLNNGIITSSSFAFTVAENGDKWYRDDNNQLRRDIYKIEKLYDISPVFEPAYLTTKATHRKVENVDNLLTKLDGLNIELLNL